jgi:hypothetical protein
MQAAQLDRRGGETAAGVAPRSRGIAQSVVLPPQPSAHIKLEDFAAQARYAEPGDAVLAPIATKEAQPTKVENVDEDAEAPTDAAKAAAGAARGVEFLQVAAIEERAACALNARLLLNAEQDGPASFEEQQLCWLQLPKVPAAAAMSRREQPQGAQSLLDDMPPGRVGRLRVHRSGKVSLVFDAVPPAASGVAPAATTYDVSTVDNVDGGVAQNLVAVLPAASGHRCYDMGAVGSKMICVPNMSES